MSLKFTVILILTLRANQVLASKGKQSDCSKITCGAFCQGTCGWSTYHHKCKYGYTTSIFEYNSGPGCKHKLTDSTTSLTTYTKTSTSTVSQSSSTSTFTATSTSTSTVSQSTSTSTVSQSTSTSTLSKSTKTSTVSQSTSTSTVSLSTKTSTSSNILPTSLSFSEITTISSDNVTETDDLKFNNSKTTLSSQIVEDNTTLAPNQNKPHHIDNSHSINSNKKINIIPIIASIVLIIGLSFLVKKRYKKLNDTPNTQNEPENSPTIDTSPRQSENDYLEPTPISSETTHNNDLNLYAEVDDNSMYDRATTRENQLRNEYEYGNSDLILNFDSDYQETEFTNRAFDYAQATSTVNYQLSSQNNFLASGLYQEPEYDSAD